jgi:hypothetical protein
MFSIGTLIKNKQDGLLHYCMPPPYIAALVQAASYCLIAHKCSFGSVVLSAYKDSPNKKF